MSSPTEPSTDESKKTWTLIQHTDDNLKTKYLILFQDLVHQKILELCPSVEANNKNLADMVLVINACYRELEKVKIGWYKITAKIEWYTIRTVF
jgi:hypothetical protein